MQYRIEYTTTTNARDFGSLTLHPSQAVDGETNVARILMKGGYVKFKGNNNNNNRDSTSGGGNASSSILPLSEDQIVLAGLEEEAKAAGKGLWGHEAAGKAPLLVKYTLEENPQELLSKWSKRPISGVVEQVRDGR